MWSLYENSASAGWLCVGVFPTGDRCKTVAKECNRNSFRYDLGKEFLIKDPSGNPWMKSVKNSGWRMKWEWVK